MHRDRPYRATQGRQPVQYDQYEDDDEMDKVEAIGAIVLPPLAPGAKFNITSTMIQLIHLNGFFGRLLNMHLYVPPRNWEAATTSTGKIFMEDMFMQIMKSQEAQSAAMNEMKRDISSANQMIGSHSVSIKQLDQQMNQLSITVN